MNDDVTIIIPVAPHHNGDILDSALNSVKVQSIPVYCKYMIDEDENGPGYIRNRLLEQVQTKYTVFLDADDYIEPTFIAECLNVIQDKRYVYTDWYQGEEVIEAPERAWCNGTWHVITAMVHTADARNVGGFDESLVAMEDTDFWLKLVTRRICGIRLLKPLSHYSKDGQRGVAPDDKRKRQLQETIMKRYKGLMGCCGDSIQVDQTIPVGQKQDGDVLAQAVWKGNRAEYGRGTGRRYPRMAYPKVTWVSPADIIARPDHWQEVVEDAVDEPLIYTGLDGFTEVLRMTGTLQKGVKPPVIAEVKPDIDVSHVVDIAKGQIDGT